MSQKKAKQKRKQKVVKNEPKKYIMLKQLIIAVLIFSMLFVAHSKKVNQAPPLKAIHQFFQPLINDPDNAHYLVKQGLSMVYEQIKPLNIQSEYIGDVNEFLLKYISSNGPLDIQLQKIKRAKQIVSSLGLSINYIPDLHEDQFANKQSRTSKKVQEKIRQHVIKYNPPYVFQESFAYEYNWQNKYQAYVADTQMLEKQVLNFNQWQTKTRQNMTKITNKVWYHYLLDNKSGVRLIGIEDDQLLKLMVTLRLIQEYYNLSLGEDPPMHILNVLEFGWRNQVIMANLVFEMHYRGIKETTLVLGAAHLYTIPQICQLWDIKLQLINFNVYYSEAHINRIISKYSKATVE